MKRLGGIFLTILLAGCSREASSSLGPVAGGDGTLFHPISWETLPPLNTPRGGHQVMLLGDQITVFGGHTDGFIPLASAEYFSGQKWTEVSLLYPHDNGASSLLPDGRVLLLGGSAESFGIGQSWGVEVYDPATHGSTAVGVLNRKRAGLSALALPDGSVVVGGNWYEGDDLEVYTPGVGFRFLKEVERQRSIPFMIPSKPDNAIIFGAVGTKGESLDGTVDRLSGEPFHEPLLDEWQVLSDSFQNALYEEMRVGEFTYLLSARHRGSGRYGLLKLSGEMFSVVPLEKDLPVSGIDGAPIMWCSNLKVNRPSRVAWQQGLDNKGRIYLARLDYNPVLDDGKAGVTLYYAEHPGIGFAGSKLILIPDGSLILAGGLSPVADSRKESGHTNFVSSREVIRFFTEESSAAAAFPWWTLLAGLLVLTVAVSLFALSGKKRARPSTDSEETLAVEDKILSRLESLLRDQEIYRQKDLTKAKAASMLGTNVTYVTAAVNGQMGKSFPELVNDYRVQHAQKLMRKHPEMTIVEVLEASGFSNESSFYRAFQQRTGQTPGQWKAAVSSGKDTPSDKQ